MIADIVKDVGAGRATTVLVVAGAHDSTADLVGDTVAGTGAEIVRFDTADFPQRAGLAVELDGDRWVGSLHCPAGSIDLTRVGAVYVRRPGAFNPPAHLTSAERWHAAMEARYGIGGILASLPVRWCNRPSASADASYKPRQATDLATCGLTEVISARSAA